MCTYLTFWGQLEDHSCGKETIVCIFGAIRMMDRTIERMVEESTSRRELRIAG